MPAHAPPPRTTTVSFQGEIAALIRQVTAEERRPLTWTIEDLVIDGLVAQKRLARPDAERIRSQRGRHAMKTIVSIAEKGEVGKTTIACVVAAGLARQGQRVLMVGPSMSRSPPPRSSSARCPPPRARRPCCWASSPSRSAATSGCMCSRAARRSMASRCAPARARRCARALQAYRGRFDCVVVDVAPVMQHLHQLALEAADLALVVTDAQSTESITGLGKVMREIQVASERGRHSPGTTIPVINKVNRRLALDTQLANSVRQKYGGQYTVIEVAATTVLPRAIARKRPEAALTEDSAAREPLGQLLKAAAAAAAGALHV